MVIKKVTREDLTSLLSLESVTFKSSESPLSKRAFKYHIEKNLLFIAKINDILVGYILIIFPRGKYARIYSLAIDKNYQGLGIASKLINYSIEKVREIKKLGLILEVKVDNISAIGLYKKFGFKELKILKNYYEDIDGVKMKLEFDTLT